MKKRACLAMLLAFALTAGGCSNMDNGSVSDRKNAVSDNNSGSEKSSAESDSDSNKKSNTDSNTDSDKKSNTDLIENPIIMDASEIFTDRDCDAGYEENKSTIIQLNGDTAECSSDAVQVSGSTVTIMAEGTYILSGTLDDGMIIVNTDKSDKVQLVLDNVDIHSETCAPIYILQSDKVFITMAADSANKLSNGGTFTAIDENNIDAVIFSKEDVTLNGAGTLVITSPAGHGIVSKDSLKITGGSYDISCASHAVTGKDDVCITNADFTLVSGKDGIHAENADESALGYVFIQSGAFHISAEGDGITASANLQIEDGSFDITAGGGSVNASSHNSDSWGEFKGGGMPEGGSMDGGMHKGGRQEDGNMGGGMRKGGRHEDGNMDGGMRKGGRQEDGNMDGGMPEDNNTGSGMTEVVSKMEMDSSNMADDADASDSTSMKGIKAAAGLIINGGKFTIDSADDSFHSNASVTINGGTFEIASGDDAFHADETLTVSDGTINITESYEGLEGMHVNVSGGDITLTASDDGLNAAGGIDSSGSTGGRDGMFGPGNPSSNGNSNGSITISGGTLKITASGDGIDANGSLAITGGSTTVSGPTQGDTATLDYDVSGTISGGIFLGTGASGRMAQTFSDSGQGVVSANVGNQSAGTQIQISDSEGNILITYTPELDFALVIFSSPDIISGETYTLTAGTSSSEFTAS